MVQYLKRFFFTVTVEIHNQLVVAYGNCSMDTVRGVLRSRCIRYHIQIAVFGDVISLVGKLLSVNRTGGMPELFPK